MNHAAFPSGSHVVYRPDLENERGVVVRQSTEELVFVRYGSQLETKATRYRDLVRWSPRLVGGHVWPALPAAVPSLVKLLGQLGRSDLCCHCRAVLRQRYGGALWCWVGDHEACCPVVAEALKVPVIEQVRVCATCNEERDLVFYSGEWPVCSVCLEQGSGHEPRQ